MTTPQDDLFASHVNMVRERAWAFAKTTRIDWEELYSEASLLFVRAATNYREGGDASFSHFAYVVITNGLTNYCAKIRETPREIDPDELVSHHGEWNPWIVAKVRDILEHLGPEATVIADIILSAPAEILHLVGWDTPTNVRSKIVTHLRKTRGWSPRRIRRGFEEIRKNF